MNVESRAYSASVYTSGGGLERAESGKGKTRVRVTTAVVGNSRSEMHD
jgi:hypothetical protein